MSMEHILAAKDAEIKDKMIIINSKTNQIMYMENLMDKYQTLLDDKSAQISLLQRQVAEIPALKEKIAGLEGQVSALEKLNSIVKASRTGQRGTDERRVDGGGSGCNDAIGVPEQVKRDGCQWELTGRRTGCELKGPYYRLSGRKKVSKGENPGLRQIFVLCKRHRKWVLQKGQMVRFSLPLLTILSLVVCLTVS